MSTTFAGKVSGPRYLLRPTHLGSRRVKQRSTTSPLGQHQECGNHTQGISYVTLLENRQAPGPNDTLIYPAIVADLSGLAK